LATTSNPTTTPSAPLPACSLKPGDTVSLSGIWAGTVLDVLTSPTTGASVVKVLFVKNVFRGQHPEWLEWAVVWDKLFAVSPDVLVAEAHELQTRLADRLAGALAGYDAVNEDVR